MATLHEQTQLLISGYFRINKSILLPTEYKLFRDIPPLILSLCCIYSIMESFCKVDASLTLSNNNMVIRGSSNLYGERARTTKWNCAYGQLNIPSDSNKHYRWDFEIKKFTNSSLTQFVVGIASTRNFNEPYHRNKFDANYAYKPDEAVTTSKYKKSFNYGSKNEYINTVSMELNLKTKELIYFVNNTHQGVAYNVEYNNEISYCLAISIADDIQVKLLRCTQLDKDDNDMK